MTLADFLLTLPAPIILCLIGRTLLAFLPAGRPGGHGPSEIWETWAASFALGLLACGLTARALELGSIRVTAAMLVVPTLLLAGAKLLSSPASMRPGSWIYQRPISIGRLELWFRRLIVLGILVALGHAFVSFAPGDLQGEPRLTLLQAQSPPLPAFEYSFWLFAGSERPGYALYPWSLIAIVILVASALRDAGRSRLGSYLIPFALAFAPVAPMWTEMAARPRSPIVGALFLVVGARYALAVLRRGDQRARTLSLIFLGSAPLLDPTLAWFALPALCLLLMMTARSIRSKPVWLSALATIPGIYALVTTPANNEADSIAGLRELFHISGPSGLWLLLGLATLLRMALAFMRARPDEVGAGASNERAQFPRREACYFGVLLALGPILIGFATALDGTEALLALEGPRSMISVLVPWMAIYCGLMLIPGERTQSARA